MHAHYAHTLSTCIIHAQLHTRITHAQLHAGITHAQTQKLRKT